MYQVSHVTSYRTVKNLELRRFPIKVHTLNEEVAPSKQKKQKHHRSNPFTNFYKETLPSKPSPYDRVLDANLLMEAAKANDPLEVIRVNLSGERIGEVDTYYLKLFSNLAHLDLSDNAIRIELLTAFESLSDLNLMCNKINQLAELPEYVFRCLEILNLSFNHIPSPDILKLTSLTNLHTLDLSANELCTLPENLSGFKQLRDLKLSNNLFTTDSVLFSASQLFASLASIPHLRKLDISRNKLRGIHSDLLTERSFPHLQELDFSFNLVDDQLNLSHSANFGSLQIIIVTGNPFALSRQTEELEEILKKENGAVLLNELPGIKKKDRVQYPRPIALVNQDFTAAIKTQLFGVELNKHIDQLIVSELDTSKEGDDDLFPKAIEAPTRYINDIYTPSNDRGSSRQINTGKSNFFITESEVEKANRGSQSGIQESQELLIRESDYTQEISVSNEASVEYTSKLEEFRKLARNLLGQDVDYDKPLDIQSAYRQLKHALKFPRVYQEKAIGPRYAQPTASRNSYKLQVRPKLVQKTDKMKALPMAEASREMDLINEQLDLYQPPRLYSV